MRNEEVVAEVRGIIDPIAVKVATIEEHLRTLNGSVSKLVEEMWGPDGVVVKTTLNQSQINQLKDDAGRMYSEQRTVERNVASNRTAGETLRYVMDKLIVPLLVAGILFLFKKYGG